MGRNLPVPNEAAPAIPYSQLNLRINKDNKEADIEMVVYLNQLKLKFVKTIRSGFLSVIFLTDMYV